MTWLFSKAMMEYYGNSHSSQEQEAESSAGNCSDGEPYAQLNVKPTPHKFWRNDKMMDHSNLSRFGLTLQLLTDGHGEAVLMSFLADFPVRTLVSQEKAQESKQRGRGSGEKRPGSLARYDPCTGGLKTAQNSLIEDLSGCSVTLPRWGTMQDGDVFQDVAVGPFTNATESGFSLPTIVKSEHKGTAKKRYLGSDSFRGAKMCEGLRTCQTDPAYLNPSFGEIVMGWPLGWTELAPLATGRFREWQRLHGLRFYEPLVCGCGFELENDDIYGCPNCEGDYAPD